MGRSPCCDKVGLKKGPWTPEEDQKLLAYIEEHGHGSWRALPSKAGLQRCGKSCRLRWTNYLRPDIKRGKFSLQEEQTIIQLHALLGNRWSAIATHLPKRTDNEIKNYWNTHLKKRLAKMGIDPATHKPKNDTLLTNDGQSKNAANLSHMAQWESARLEAEARLVRESKLRSHSLIQHQQALNAEGPHNLPVSPNTSQLPRSLEVLKAWSAPNGGWSSSSSSLKSGGGGDNVHNGRINGGSGNLNGNSSFNNGVDQLESPTSTLTFSENINNNATQTLNISSTIGHDHHQNSVPMIEFVGSSSSSGQIGLVKEEREQNHDWKGHNLSENSLSYTSGIHDHLTISMEGPWTPESLRTNNSGLVHGVMEAAQGFTSLLVNESGDQVLSIDESGKDSDHNDGGSEDFSEDNKNYWNSILNLVNSSPSSSPMF